MLNQTSYEPIREGNGRFWGTKLLLAENLVAFGGAVRESYKTRESYLQFTNDKQSLCRKQCAVQQNILSLRPSFV